MSDRVWTDFPNTAFFFRRLENVMGNGTQTVFKPLGAHDYGYQYDYMTISSWTIWVLNTIGNLSIGLPEGLLVLISAMLLNEMNSDGRTHGVSLVHNMQAGFNMYYYFLKNEITWPVFLGVLSELVGDLGAVVEEIVRESRIFYNHSAHLNGIVYGIFFGFFIDFFKNRIKLRPHRFFWVLPTTLFILFLKQFYRNYITNRPSIQRDEGI